MPKTYQQGNWNYWSIDIERTPGEIALALAPVQYELCGDTTHTI